MPHRPTVLVVGGGFCGAAVALHLLRDHATLPVDIVVVEPRATLGAGLAYGTADPEHRVNVAAARMSPFPEDPNHFDKWLRAHGDPESDPASVLPDGRLFPRRATYGRYVAETLAAAAGAGQGPTLRHLRTHATAAHADPAGTTVTLATGDTLRADVLVLAVGHATPDLPAALHALRDAPGLVADPWDTARLDAIDRAAPVLVVGTGLTACDTVASLRARGHAGPITLASRRGLLPRPRTDLPVTPVGRFDAPPAPTALALLRATRRAVAAAAAEGRPWESVIAALREQARPVWSALPLPERRRLLRHLRPFWDVHRFQCAPQIDALLRRERASGRVTVLAATPTASRIAPDGTLAVDLRPRGTATATTHRFGAVVSCVGPGHRSVVASSPVLRALHDAGTLHADPLSLGIAVDPRSRVLDTNGRPNPRVFVAGPLARERHGELMGLPQVSTQPREVAASVAALLNEARPEALSLESAEDLPPRSAI
ncbi:MAG: FAD/NAD(P)-binding protein [Janthinobacterium lividum]